MSARCSRASTVTRRKPHACSESIDAHSTGASSRPPHRRRAAARREACGSTLRELRCLTTAPRTTHSATASRVAWSITCGSLSQQRGQWIVKGSAAQSRFISELLNGNNQMSAAFGGWARFTEVIMKLEFIDRKSVVYGERDRTRGGR